MYFRQFSLLLHTIFFYSKFNYMGVSYFNNPTMQGIVSLNTVLNRNPNKSGFFGSEPCVLHKLEWKINDSAKGHSPKYFYPQ